MTVRRVGDSEADAVYAGTPKENASHKVVNPDGKRGLSGDCRGLISPP